MEFWLKKAGDDMKIQLPVKPSDFLITVANKNTVVNVIQLGDISLMGKTGLREITLSSFFPAKDYNFSNNSVRKAPLTYVNKINEWRNSGEPIRVVITGKILNMLCTIESFSYGEQDATGDIYYTIALREYKQIKTKSASADEYNASSRETKAVSTKAGTYKVQKGDSLWKIAKQVYGNGAEYMRIFNANKNKLSDPNVIQIGMILTIPELSNSSVQAIKTARDAVVTKARVNGAKSNTIMMIN